MTVNKNINHVICMEDDAQIRRLLLRKLSRIFDEVCLVDTCELLVANFLKKISATGLSFDLVFLDMEIYGDELCGLRALDELKRIDPNVRTILCSSSGHAAMYNPKQYGFIASLEKDFSIEQLDEALRNVFD